MRGTPWNYLEKCRVALTAYENGGEFPLGWSIPPVPSEDDDSDSGRGADDVAPSALGAVAPPRKAGQSA